MAGVILPPHATSSCASERRPPLPAPRNLVEPNAVLSTDPHAGPRLTGSSASTGAQTCKPLLSTFPTRRRPPTACTAVQRQLFSTDPQMMHRRQGMANTSAITAQEATVAVDSQVVSAVSHCLHGPAAIQPCPMRATKLATAPYPSPAHDDWPRLNLGQQPQIVQSTSRTGLGKQGNQDQYRPGELLLKSASVDLGADPAFGLPLGCPPGIWTTKGEAGIDYNSLDAHVRAPAGFTLIQPQKGPPSVSSGGPAASMPAPFGANYTAASACGTSEAADSPRNPEQDDVADLRHALRKLNIEPSELPSIGSAEHHKGTCKPCAFIFKDGCQAGIECRFCHLCEQGEKRRRKREHKAAKRALRHGQGQTQPSS
mmetsp:Transcript_119842/g.310943  ORF Transcript_119842/g.310943 Transcript_119842/m.310943 type:complete len:370 (-) Transcript_119842:35-1144(-)